MKKIFMILSLILMFAIPQAWADTIIYGGFIPTISSSTNNGLLCWSGTFGNTVKDCSGAPTFDGSGNLVVSGLRDTGLSALKVVVSNADKVLTSGTNTDASVNAAVAHKYTEDALTGIVSISAGTYSGLGSTGTGNVVKDTSPTIKGLIFETSANFASIDVSPNTIWGSGYTGSGALVRSGGNIGAATGTSVSVSGDVSGATIKGVVPNQIIGDGTAGRVLRISQIVIVDGTAANTIKTSSAVMWNGDTNAAEDNMGVGYDGTAFALEASGQLLFKNGGIQGDAVAVMAALLQNTTGTQIHVYPYKVTEGIRMVFKNPATWADLDLFTLVDSGGAYINITYITNQ